MTALDFAVWPTAPVASSRLIAVGAALAADGAQRPTATRISSDFDVFKTILLLTLAAFRRASDAEDS